MHSRADSDGFALRLSRYSQQVVLATVGRLRDASLVLVMLIAGITSAHANTLPQLAFNNSGRVVTNSGEFELSWSPSAAAGGYEFARVEQAPSKSGFGFSEESKWHQHALSIDSRKFAYYNPGPYRFRVRACRRVVDGSDGSESIECGAASPEMTVTVAESAATSRPVVPGSSVPAPDPGTVVTEGAPTTAPGVYHSEYSEHVAWTFYWASKLRYPIGSEEFGDINELHALWLTYRDFASTTLPPGFENIQPVWILAKLDQTDQPNVYQGSLEYLRNGEPATTGQVTITLRENDTPIVVWFMHDQSYYKEREVYAVTDTLSWAFDNMAIQQGPSPLDHFSGAWSSEDNGPEHNYIWSGHITGNFEFGSLIFYDTVGEPIWVAASNDDSGPPLTTQTTGYCAVAVTNAWYPDVDFPDPEVRDVVRIPVGDCSDDGWNIQRSYGPQQPGVSQPGSMVLDINVPQSVRGIEFPFVSGTQGSPAPIHKQIGLHDVRYLINGVENPSQCQASATGDCTLSLTYFSDGDYPQARVYRVRKQGSAWVDPVPLSGWLNPDRQSVLNLPHTISNVTTQSTYRFELRRESGSNQLLAFSPDLVVVPPAPPPGPPETPPAPVPDPGFEVDSVSARAGATRGEFRVDESGAATYSIGVMTVQGSGNLAPELSLNYSSRGGEGLLGRGWQLGGQSTISRCGQATEFGDAETRAVDLTDQDQFCLDGQRLLWVSGQPHGTLGAVYRQELDQFVQVTVTAVTGSGSASAPTEFKVQRRDGSATYYGDATAQGSARVMTSIHGQASTVLVWPIRRIEDSAGNYIDYSYTHVQHPLFNNNGSVEYLLDKVSYTGRANQAPFATVEFDYSELAAHQQVRSYIAGQLTRSTRRLDTIRSKVDTQLVRRYALSYQNNDGSGSSMSRPGQPLLTSVRECYGEGANDCLAPTQFDYHIGSASLPTVPTADGLGTPPSIADYSSSFPADLNGDGRQDLVVVEGKHDQAAKFRALLTLPNGSLVNSNSVTAKCGTKIESLGTVQPIDLEGTGFQGFIYAAIDCANPVDEGLWYHDYDASLGRLGEAIKVGEIPGEPWTEAEVSVLDWTGDGLADLVIHFPGYWEYTGSNWHPTGVLAPVWVWENQSLSNPGATLAFKDPERVRGGFDWLPPSPPSNVCTTPGFTSPNYAFEVTVHRVGAFAADGSGRAAVVADSLVRVRCEGAPDSTESEIVSREEFESVASGIPTPFVYVSATRVFNITPNTQGAQSFKLESYANLRLGEIIDTVIPVDVNGDGLSDFVTVDVRACSSACPVRLQINAGRPVANNPLNPAIDQFTVPVEVASSVRMIDYNADGHPDLLVPSSINSDSARWKVHAFGREFGDGFGGFSPTANLSGGFAPLAGNLLPEAQNEAPRANSVFLDRNGDGRIDQLLLRKQSGTWRFTQAVGDHNVPQCASMAPCNLHTLRQITDGLDATTSLEYRALTQRSVYTRDVAGPYLNWGRGAPVYDLVAPMYVVASASSLAPQYTLSADGLSSSYSANAVTTTRYYYTGGKIQAGGRGFLGFAEVASYDPRSAVLTRTRYAQQFPFIGMPLRTDSYYQTAAPWPQNDATAGALTPCTDCSNTAIETGIIVLGESITDWQALATTGGAVHPYIERVEDIHYTPVLSQGSYTSSALTHRAVTVNSNLDAYGNVGHIVLTTYDAFGTMVAEQTTVNAYEADDVSKWYLGRLSCSTVTSNRPNTPPLTRRSRFAYDSDTGILIAETIQPDSCASIAGYETHTEYELNEFGLRTRTTVHARELEFPRASAVDYDDRGRFVDTEYAVFIGTNSQSATEIRHVLTRDKYGNETEVRDALGVISYQYYDPLGRMHYSYSPTGAWSRVLHRMGAPAGNLCPADTAMYDEHSAAGGSNSLTCRDKLNRPTRTVTWSVTNAAIYADTHYDDASRPLEASEPYFASATSYWTRTAYDEFGRAEVIYFPDNSPSLISRSSISYEGLITRTTNALGQISVVEVNALGETVREVSAEGTPDQATTHLGYDALGRLVSTDGPLNNDTITIQYSLTGHKTQVTDPDKGVWRYHYNGLGELVCQLDAKGQALGFGYDHYGRLFSKLEFSGVSNVQNCGAGGDPDGSHAIIHGPVGSGQIIGEYENYEHPEVGGQWLIRGYNYDELGRLNFRGTSIFNEHINGSDYEERTTYDQYGRVFQQFDASGGDRGVRQIYGSQGHLTGLREAAPGTQGQVYWTLMATDARGQPTLAQLGNGFQVTATYEPSTGRPLGLKDQNGAVLAHDLELRWDAIGNLTWRRDSAQAVPQSERFEYNHRNFLRKVYDTFGAGPPNPAVPTPERLELEQLYDRSGNITYKRDVGNYVYANGRPHAVSSAGGVGYFYDANGNLSSDNTGRTLVYNGRDQVIRITKGTAQTEFHYDWSGGRLARHDLQNGVLTESTHYVGSVEVLHKNGTRQFRRMIGGAVIATWHEDTALTEVSYQHKDHLGSITAISNESGQIVAEMSFDAWGQRRQPQSWNPLQPPTPGQLNAMLAITPHGYTGHEHVDSMGIVHMNGRIYDPRLGRMLQADPFVEDRGTLNRYTYVHNNPLVYTDPSGYFSVSRLLDPFGLTRLVAKAVGPNAAGVLNSIASTYCGPFAPACAAFGQYQISRAHGGTQSDALQSAAVAGVSRAVFHQLTPSGGTPAIGSQAWAEMTLTHGLAGGTLSVLQGGKFGHGFISAAGTAALTPVIGPIARKNYYAGLVVSTVIGGSISKASGGKFANGAASSAMGYVLQTSRGSPDESSGSQTCAYGDCPGENLIAGPIQVKTPTRFHYATSVGIASVEGFSWVDAIAGFGDTASFGLSAYIRTQWGIGSVDYDSVSYGYGTIAGTPAMVGTLAAGGIALNVGIRAAGGANTLYHFTSTANAASIARSGVLRAGPHNLYGPGPYATVFRSPGMTGAASSEAVIVIQGQASRAIATPFPGTFRFGGPIRIP